MNKKKKIHPAEEELCRCRILHANRIKEARESILSADQVEEVTRLCKALADPNRVRMLWALLDGEMCVCDLAAFLGITESAVSHQLRLLRTHGLVTNRRSGPVLYYRLRDDRARRLLFTTLDRTAPEGTP
ncbi:MAG: metalloregulator ArsR/SmtB family transcription factor [Deltaproteobacteria bacterium]|jgi:DNA-binding transcriptional ArsR family regulator